MLFLWPINCGDEKLLFAFPKTPSGWVNRASSNSNFRSRLGGGDVETRRFFLLLLFAIAPGADDAEVLILPSRGYGCFPPNLSLLRPTKESPSDSFHENNDRNSTLCWHE